VSGPVARSDEGTGVFSTAIAVLVFLLFLLFAVQLLVSLYATSTVTAVTNDAVQRAATGGADLGAIEAEARASLGEVGRTAEFTWEQADADGDGATDTISLEVHAHPPRFLPRSIGDAVGLTDIDHSAVARLEEFR
jgi:hypothetical protein